jgi:hypothetical protein
MSVEAYIPYDLRERLAEQIKVIDKMVTDAVAAERERCERVLLALLHASYSMSGPQALQRALSEIRKGE